MPLKISLHPLDRNPTGSDASAFTELGERAFENDPVHIARGHGRGISPAQREEILAWRRARFAVRSKATEVHVFKAVATADDEEESGEGRFVGAIALVAPSERPGAAAGGAGGAGGVEGEKKTEAGEGEGGGRPKRYEGVPAFLNLAVFDEMERVMTAAQKRHVGDVSKVWYLQTMFVDPDYQGRGIGGKLMQRGMELVDADGRDCYVEASAAGVGVYRRAGFEVREELPLETAPGTITIMIRKARPRTDDVTAAA